MKKTVAVLFYTIISFVVFHSCKEDDKPPDNTIDINTGHGVFIVNEGNFQWSNASVTFYDFTTGSYKEDIFKDVNNRPLGDVAQSIYVYNGKGYIVVNNSNKIEVVNMSDFSSSGVISGLVSPRYFLPVDAAKAYVTDLYSNNISVVDLNTNNVVETIPCKGSTEEMLHYNDVVIVTNTRSDKIYLISTNSDEIADSIQLGFAGTSLRMDKNNKLWVMCAGDAGNSVKAAIYKVDIQQKQVEHCFQLNTSLDIWDKLTINSTRDTLYYMCKGIYRMPVTATDLPSQAFIQQGSALFHGLAVNPVNNNIFVADAVDYVQKGKVYYYDSGGTLKGTINTGIIPVDFYFY